MTQVVPLQKTDPFEFPKHMVPRGLAYLWSSEKIMGESNPHHDRRLAEGWVAVPAQWHRPYFDGPDGPVKVRGNVLLCHAAVRDEEAERIAGAQRNIDNWQKRYGEFSGGVRIQRQSSESVEPLRTLRLGDASLAQQIAPLPTKREAVPRRDAAPWPTAREVPISTSIKQRMPRHRLLGWLFNLISVEKTS